MNKYNDTHVVAAFVGMTYVHPPCPRSAVSL